MRQEHIIIWLCVAYLAGALAVSLFNHYVT